jgi:hypothetical protein
MNRCDPVRRRQAAWLRGMALLPWVLLFAASLGSCVGRHSASMRAGALRGRRGVRASLRLGGLEQRVAAARGGRRSRTGPPRSLRPSRLPRGLLCTQGHPTAWHLRGSSAPRLVACLRD